MKVAVSACLLGENCKYSGGSNRCERLLEALRARPDIEVIPVCPEVAGGLPTPRPPAEIVDGEVVNDLGESVDAAYRAGVAAEMVRLSPAIESGELAAAVLYGNARLWPRPVRPGARRGERHVGRCVRGVGSYSRQAFNMVIFHAHP